MKKQVLLALRIVFVFTLCIGMLSGCDDDDNGNKNAITTAIDKPDASHGYIMNSLSYTVLIDIDEKEKFNLSLSPGMTVELRLKANKTHLLHAVVLNAQGRVMQEFVNSFYIDDVPLDNQLKDYLCSWYVELTSEYGFGNNLGT
ncbi:hypothetical protein U27_02744 [Candidatus Vecturithrix granuli]|uniref:Lipoprotein n=1 Tax=Vecturithrix granuli TaxID=1499967 RepID=A0A081BTY0_VECG1|nr:hypothetical protein U27_02744 [Candidatus Vecturithrix granuli]